jgi:hypothetical protein
MRRAVTVVLGALLLAAIAFGVLEIVNYDGRSPMEKLEAETASERPGYGRLASCPAIVPRERRLPDRNARNRDEIAPDGASQLLLCRYYGLGFAQTPRELERPGTLAAEVTLRGTAAAAIARRFDEIDYLPKNAFYHCPGDEGSRIFAIFRYPHEPPVPVEVSLSGCRFAGARGRPYGVVPPSLLDRLERLTRE